MSLYLYILVLSGAVPLIISFWPPLKFYTHWRSLITTIGLIVMIFGSWDVFATWRGHWYFAPSGVGTITIINLPLEEVLFFVVIPFCCLFTWEALNFLARRRP